MILANIKHGNIWQFQELYLFNCENGFSSLPYTFGLCIRLFNCTIINSKFESLKFLTASKNIKFFTSN